MALDRTDLALLALLENDARTTHKELAKAVGLAPSSCHGRLERLRADGVLRAVRAEVDAEALGFQLQAFVSIQLAAHAQGVDSGAMAKLLDLDEVIALDHVAGTTDLIVRVATRDVHHLRTVVMDSIQALDEVRHVETTLIFEHHRKSALAEAALRAHDAEVAATKLSRGRAGR